MPNERVDLRRIDWTQTFPFVRIFRTFSYAMRLERMTLAFVLIFLLYVIGGVLDRVWVAAGGGVPVLPISKRTAVEAYTQLPDAQFEQALQRAAGVYQRLSDELNNNADQHDPRSLFDRVREIYNTQLAELKAVDADGVDETRHQLAVAHDYLMFSLAGKKLMGEVAELKAPRAFETLGVSAEDQQALLKAISLARMQSSFEEAAPMGPYAALQRFVLQCASGAVRGTLSFRFGMEGGAFSPKPSLAACVIQGGQGLMYYFLYRPWFSLVFGLLAVIVAAYFGGALLRHAAIQMTRDELVGLGDAFMFARQKLPQMLLGPLGVVGGVLVITLVLIVGGLLGAIPVIGPVLSGALFGLALLGGLVITLVLIALVFSVHLMWPQIAVEGSDAYDAISRGASYAGQRLWNLVFYSLTLLAYGSFALLLVRIIAMFVLKTTHATVGIGMSFFGAATSARTETLDRLSALWQMPSWSELSLLPTLDTPFWGDFFHAPLSGSETLAAILIAIWVFTVVGLVGAFAASFYFCGWTQIYLLIRHDHDAIGFEDVYYEGEEVFPMESGTSLPVVAGEGPSSAPAESASDSPETPDSKD
jgi:hypothetical protein